MSKPARRSRILSIDACVLRSAGDSAGHASHCRGVLDAILALGHRAGSCKALAQEWKQHMSTFARQWYQSMWTNKRVVLIDVTANHQSLTEQVAACTLLNEKTEHELHKDLHLLALAREADKVIITGDSRLKEHVKTHLPAVASPLEWLITHPRHSQAQCQEIIQRLGELTKARPRPPIPHSLPLGLPA